MINTLAALIPKVTSSSDCYAQNFVKALDPAYSTLTAVTTSVAPDSCLLILSHSSSSQPLSLLPQVRVHNFCLL